MAKRRAEKREGMVVTTIALPQDLHKRLAIASIEEGAAMTELLRDVVREYLDKRERTRKKGGSP